MAEMTDTEPLPERVERIEHKLDALSASVDRRFDEVSEHFVEQREYTEFAFERLRQEMLDGFKRLENKLDTNVERLERKLDRFMAAHAASAPQRRPRRVPKKR